MSEQSIFNLILSLNIISFVLSTILCVYSFRFRGNKSAFGFFVLMCIFALWTATQVVSMFVSQLSIAIIISDIVRGITTFTPFIILYIVITYTNYPVWFTDKHTKYLFTLPAVLAILSFTESIFHWFTSDYSIEFLYRIPILHFNPQPLFIIYPISIYFCLLVSLAILFRSLLVSNPFFRKQLLFILVAILLPAINVFFYWLGYSLITNYHLLTVSFVVGNCFFAWALFGYSFLKLIPFARSVVIDTIEDIVIVTDIHNRLIDINQSGLKLLKIKLNDVIGKLYSEVLPPEFNRVFEAKRKGEIVLETDGKLNYFSVSYSKVERDINHLLLNNFVLHNISEYKKQELQIKESERKFRSIFNFTGTGIAIINAEGKYLDINPTYTKITGYELNELRNTPIGMMSHPDSKHIVAETREFIEQQNTNVFSTEYQIIHKNGSTKWLWLTVQNYFNAQGKFEYVLIEFFDITDRKNSELQLKVYYEVLQKHSKKLEDTIATKDKFFSIIAHDLRNPFNGMIGLTSHIINSFDIMERDKILRIIGLLNEAAINGYKLLENLLEWSRLQTNSISFKPQQHFLETLISDAIDMVGNIAHQKKISIVNSHIESIEVYLDYNMIFTVLRNLLSNSVKFTNENGEIQINTTFDDEFVTISVSDNGVGMSSDTYKNLFSIETKNSTIGTAGEKGTGLGLVLCREFVLKHGGKIWIESEENKGTTVTFTIPIKLQAIEFEDNISNNTDNKQEKYGS